MHADVLVVGSGIAGLSYTLKLAQLKPDCRIVMLSKRDVLESNTKYAQGGIAVVQDFDDDSFEKHIQDTLIAGDGLCNPEVVSFVVKEGPDRLKELLAWGTNFDKEGDHLHLGKEGGHTAHRIVHFKDKSGFEIQQSLISQLKKTPNVTLLENHTLVNLITEHQINSSAQRRCYGAYVISLIDERIVKITAQATVLSTGGAGQVYEFNTNPSGATGDGIAAAYRAKVPISNIHFVQFHPTALQPKLEGETFLISEAVRGEGAVLKNHLGERFMFQYDARGELASRDIVARAIEIELNKSEDAMVYLDCSPIGEINFKNHFPTILEACHRVGVNPFVEGIPVVPAAHYFCGGIDVDEHSATPLKGLYAIGECSHTGLHGANRLASNSLLEALVFAHRAAQHSSDFLEGEKLDDAVFEQIPDWKHYELVQDKERKTLTHLKKAVQSLMNRKVAIFKSTKGLLEAERELASLYKASEAWYVNHKLSPQICELRNLINIAYLIIKQSQNCTENKGGFFNNDYAHSI